MLFSKKIYKFVSIFLLILTISACSSVNKKTEIVVTSSKQTHIKYKDFIFETPAKIEVGKKDNTFKILDGNSEVQQVKIARIKGKPSDTFVDIDKLGSTVLDCKGKRNKKIIDQNALIFGRIRIYQLFDDGRIKELSDNAKFTLRTSPMAIFSKTPNKDIKRRLNQIGIKRDGYIGFDEGGLVVFTVKDDVKSIKIDSLMYIDDSRSWKKIDNFRLVLNNIDKTKNTYFGDINIFISGKPDFTETKSELNFISTPYYTTTYREYYTINHFYPKKITLDNNRDGAIKDIERAFGGIKNNQEFVNNNMRILVDEEEKNIEKSKKQMPF